MPNSVLTLRKDLGMAYYYPEAAHTFSEYLLVPGYSGSEHTPERVSLRTPLTRFRRGEEPRISLNIPMICLLYTSDAADE